MRWLRTLLDSRHLQQRVDKELKFHIDAISKDSRYAFMFGSLTVNDGMTEVLGRIFRVPVDNKPITILELTGLPMEIVNVVVSVLARMTFDLAHWSPDRPRPTPNPTYRPRCAASGQ